MKQRHPKLNMYESAVFRICIQGQLHANWAEYHGTQSISVELDADGNGVTTLISEPMDQGALVGLINHLNSLGVPLISVEMVISHG